MKWGLGIGDWGLGIGDWGLGLDFINSIAFSVVRFCFHIKYPAIIAGALLMPSMQ